MSAIINDPTLQVYLKLDRLSVASGIKTTTDFSQFKKSAVINGAPILASDDLFANSLQCNGIQDFVEFADPFANDTVFTLSIWVCPDALNDGVYHGIMGHQGAGGLTTRKPSLWLMPSNKGLHYDSYTSDGQRFKAEIPNFFEDAGEWVHIAWVKDGTQYLLYRNGVLFYQAAAPAQFARNSALPFHIGRAETYFWKGRLAHARVYSRALTIEEINWDIDEDRTAMAAFRSTHPVSFTLSSDGHENVMYIVADPAKQALNITVQNDSRNTIEFEAATTVDAGPDAHHFSLHFRPGALSAASVAAFPNVALPGWKKGVVRRADGGVILYFLKTTAFSLSLGQTVSFDLTSMSADSKGGARNTVVELHFREKPAYSANDKLPSRYRTQQISIVNHLGQTHFPVHFGAVGSNTILNDGSTNPAIVFHLANLLPVTDPARPEKAYLRFKGKNNNPTDYTKLILTFDTQLPNTTREWALCKSDELAGMQPTIAGWLQESVDLNIQSPKWTFRRDTDLDLKAGEFLNIQLTGLKSSLPSGLTRIILCYENVAGYWDGQLVAPVEKSIMTYRPNGAVGIGSGYAAANNYMDKGSLTVGSIHQNYGGGNSWNKNTAGLMLECATNTEVAVHDSGTRICSLLHYEGDAVNRISMGRDMGWGKTNVRVAGNLSVEGGGGYNIDLQVSGRMRSNNNEGGLWVAEDRFVGGHSTNKIGFWNGNAWRLTVQNDGTVGIGTNDPKHMLDVNGAMRAHRYYDDDTNFYVDSNATSVMNVIHASVIHDRENTGYYVNPGGRSSIQTLFIGENYEVGGNNNVLNIRGNTNENYPLIFAENKNKGWVFYAHSNHGMHYGKNSSILLKKNVRPIEGALEKLRSLEGVRFEWKESNVEDIGFIAEEVGKHVPEAVTFGDDGFATGMSYDHIIPLLVEAMKEQQKMIEKLTKQVEALTR